MKREDLADLLRSYAESECDDGRARTYHEAAEALIGDEGVVRKLQSEVALLTSELGIRPKLLETERLKARTLAADLEAARAEIAKLKSQRSALLDGNAAQVEESCALSRRCIFAEKQFVKASATIEQLHRTLATRDIELSTARAERDTERARAEKAERERDEALHRLDSRDEECDRLEVIEVRNANQLSALRTERDALNATVENLRRETKDLRKKLLDAQAAAHVEKYLPDGQSRLENLRKQLAQNLPVVEKVRELQEARRRDQEATAKGPHEIVKTMAAYRQCANELLAMTLPDPLQGQDISKPLPINLAAIEERASARRRTL